MRRKAAALVLCMLLVVQLAAPAWAAETVYFTAISDYVQPLADETMPFWSGGFLYIPATLFSGEVKKELDIGYIYNASRRLLVLHRPGRSLTFDLDKVYAYDEDGNTYFPSAVLRGGVVFVPVSQVAQFFGLTYSVTEVEQGYLVWLREPGAVLTDAQFADAARSRMRSQYEQYLKDREAAQVPVRPEVPDSFAGRQICLCFAAEDAGEVEPLLDALDRRGGQAAFFCTPEFLAEEGGLLRRMAATGHAVGILADGSDPERPVAAQLEEGNRALYAATCGMTRLAYVENGGRGETVEGYCLLSPDLDRGSYPLTSAASAATLRSRMGARPGNVSVWLGSGSRAAGLGAFLQAAQQAGDHCLALVEPDA